MNYFNFPSSYVKGVAHRQSPVICDKGKETRKKDGSDTNQTFLRDIIREASLKNNDLNSVENLETENKQNDIYHNNYLQKPTVDVTHTWETDQVSGLRFINVLSLKDRKKIGFQCVYCREKQLFRKKSSVLFHLVTFNHNLKTSVIDDLKAKGLGTDQRLEFIKSQNLEKNNIQKKTEEEKENEKEKGKEEKKEKEKENDDKNNHILIKFELEFISTLNLLTYEELKRLHSFYFGHTRRKQKEGVVKNLRKRTKEEKEAEEGKEKEKKEEKEENKKESVIEDILFDIQLCAEKYCGTIKKTYCAPPIDDEIHHNNFITLDKYLEEIKKKAKEESTNEKKRTSYIVDKKCTTQTAGVRKNVFDTLNNSLNEEYICNKNEWDEKKSTTKWIYRGNNKNEEIMTSTILQNREKEKKGKKWKRKNQEVCTTTSLVPVLPLGGKDAPTARMMRQQMKEFRKMEIEEMKKKMNINNNDNNNNNAINNNDINNNIQKGDVKTGNIKTSEDSQCVVRGKTLGKEHELIMWGRKNKINDDDKSRKEEEVKENTKSPLNFNEYQVIKQNGKTGINSKQSKENKNENENKTENEELVKNIQKENCLIIKTHQNKTKRTGERGSGKQSGNESGNKCRNESRNKSGNESGSDSGKTSRNTSGNNRKQEKTYFRNNFPDNSAFNISQKKQNGKWTVNDLLTNLDIPNNTKEGKSLKEMLSNLLLNGEDILSISKNRKRTHENKSEIEVNDFHRVTKKAKQEKISDIQIDYKKKGNEKIENKKNKRKTGKKGIKGKIQTRYIKVKKNVEMKKKKVKTSLKKGMKNTYTKNIKRMKNNKLCKKRLKKAKMYNKNIREFQNETAKNTKEKTEWKKRNQNMKRMKKNGSTCYKNKQMETNNSITITTYIESDKNDNKTNGNEKNENEKNGQICVTVNKILELKNHQIFNTTTSYINQSEQITTGNINNQNTCGEINGTTHVAVQETLRQKIITEECTSEKEKKQENVIPDEIIKDPFPLSVTNHLIVKQCGYKKRKKRKTYGWYKKTAKKKN